MTRAFASSHRLELPKRLADHSPLGGCGAFSRHRVHSGVQAVRESCASQTVSQPFDQYGEGDRAGIVESAISPHKSTRPHRRGKGRHRCDGDRTGFLHAARYLGAGTQLPKGRDALARGLRQRTTARSGHRHWGFEQRNVPSSAGAGQPETPGDDSSARGRRIGQRVSRLPRHRARARDARDVSSPVQRRASLAHRLLLHSGVVGQAPRRRTTARWERMGRQKRPLPLASRVAVAGLRARLHTRTIDSRDRSAR